MTLRPLRLALAGPLLALTLPALAIGCTSGSPEVTDSGTAEGGAASPSAAEAEVADDASDDASDDTSDYASTDPSADAPADATSPMDENTATPSDDSNLEVATLGAGCYWCIEAVLEQVNGVKDVVSGFMGGEKPDPTYAEVCTGTTGHAEVVQVEFDPKVLPYEHLLAWFWKLHDPTTLNRQGRDVGTQYRSAIFTHSDAQAETARRSLAAAQADFADPIVTEITPASKFYIAPDKHQDYYWANKEAGYCRVVIAPKLKKLDLEH